MLYNKQMFAPKHLTLAITNSCNSQCSHCNIWLTYVKNPTLQKLELRYYEYTKIFEYAPESIKHIDITGGEPFLYTNLFEVVTSARRNLPHLKKISLTTNGIHENTICYVSSLLSLDQVFSKELKLKIFVSVDGMSSDYSTIRGITAWDKVLTTLLDLIELKKTYKNLDVSISSTLVANRYFNNCESLIQLFRLVNKLGIHVSTINVAAKSKFYRHKSLNVSNKALTEAFTTFEKAFPNKINSLHLKYLQNKQSDSKDKLINLECISPKHKLIIDCYGNLRGCIPNWTEDFKIGNLRHYNYIISKTIAENYEKYQKIINSAKNQDCCGCFTPCEYSIWFKYSKHNREVLKCSS